RSTRFIALLGTYNDPASGTAPVSPASKLQNTLKAGVRWLRLGGGVVAQFGHATDPGLMGAGLSQDRFLAPLDILPDGTYFAGKGSTIGNEDVFTGNIGSNCSDWNSTSAGNVSVGYSFLSGSMSFSANPSAGACNVAHRLYCMEKE